VHFDPVGSEQHPFTEINEFSDDDVLARSARGDGASTRDRVAVVAGGVDDSYSEDAEEDEEEESEPPVTVREGLPARFRMRHTSHYVDALLGDAPLRTVREIPVAEIEAPIDDLAELDELEQSIRQLGVIEPLLVGRRGASYRVIAGMRRLRAAQRVGLETVPCLVHDVDEDRLADMRGAAAHRVTIAAPAPPEPPPESPVAFEAAVPPAHAAIGEAALGLEFVAALLPAMNAAGGDRLRWGVLTDLAAVELSRAKTMGAALEVLQRARPIDRKSADYQVLVSDVVSRVAAEARLRNVRLDVSLAGNDTGRDIFLDGALCRDALTGMLQCLLALAPRTGALLNVAAQMTSIRPALIVECVLRESEPELSSEAFARFFDAAWREHPCGLNGGSVLAAFATVARMHGGRVDVKPAANGCQVTFVVPRIEG
jgi:ParB/Sulfiredoxin domain